MELRATFPMEESSRTNYPDVITEVPENEYSRRTGETKKVYGAKTASVTEGLSLRHFVSQSQKRPRTTTGAHRELLWHISTDASSL